MKEFFDRFDQALKGLVLKEISQAQRVLVGLGSGFPLAAGLPPLPFTQQVEDRKYWQVWAPFIQQQRLEKTSNPCYVKLMELLSEKDYFIVDSNPDGYLLHSGAEAKRLYKIQGDLARVQCAENCSDQVYPARVYLEGRRKQEESLLCPECGAPLRINVDTKSNFCARPYAAQRQAYFQFINRAPKERLVLLELGVGYSRPELIRFPFEQITNQHSNVRLIRVNTKHPLCVEENREKALCIGVDLKEVLYELTR